MHRFICHRLLMRTTRLASTALAVSAATLAIHSFSPLVADETPTYDPIEGERSVLVTTTDALPDQEPAPERPDDRPAEADPAENRPPDPPDHDGATNPVEQADEPQDGPPDSATLSEPDDLPAAFGETEFDAAITPLSDATFVPDTPVFENLPPQTASVYGGETQSLTEQDFDVDAPAIEAARLNGLQPGTTTKADLLAGWGAPKSRVHDTNAETFVYRFAPFEKIEAVLHDNVISEIAVELRERIPPETLARQLRVHKLAPVEIIDGSGIAIGRAFPERGVLFTYAPDSAEPQVSHILLKPIDDELFLLRAEQESARKIGKSIADLRRVLKLSPNQATARWKLAEAYRRVGSVTEAESMANSAVELDPNDRRYRLSWAYALKELGRYPEAVREARRVARSDHANAVARAEALVLLGDLAAVSRGDVSKKAIELYNQAIQVADANAASEVPGERLAIKRVLVAAHLATAREIAQGKWRQKATVVPQWIERASALAEGAIQHDGGGLELRLAGGHGRAGGAGQLPTDARPDGLGRGSQEDLRDVVESDGRRTIEASDSLAYGPGLLPRAADRARAGPLGVCPPLWAAGDHELQPGRRWSRCPGDQRASHRPAVFPHRGGPRDSPEGSYAGDCLVRQGGPPVGGQRSGDAIDPSLAAWRYVG